MRVVRALSWETHPLKDQAAMPIGKFAHTHLPYCLQRIEDGSWIVLNRNYKPIGATSRDRIDYMAAPGRLMIDGRTLEPLARRMHNVERDGAGKPVRMWLYDDGNQPSKDKSTLDEYLYRLGFVANAKVKPLKE
jgi:hypothetical protein